MKPLKTNRNTIQGMENKSIHEQYHCPTLSEVQQKSLTRGNRKHLYWKPTDLSESCLLSGFFFFKLWNNKFFIMKNKKIARNRKKRTLFKQFWEAKCVKAPRVAQ